MRFPNLRRVWTGKESYNNLEKELQIGNKGRQRLRDRDRVSGENLSRLALKKSGELQKERSVTAVSLKTQRCGFSWQNRYERAQCVCRSLSIPCIPGPSADPSALPPSAQNPSASAAVSQLHEQLLGRCSPETEEKASQGKPPRCGSPAVWLKLSSSHHGRANLPQHPGF